MKSKIAKIKDLYNGQVESNRQFLHELSELNNSKDYSNEYKADRRKKLSDAYSTKSLQAKEEIMKQLYEMKKEEQAHVDLSDISLLNALKIIETMGSTMPSDIIKDINRTFKGKQAALQIIKNACEKNNIYNHEIKELCYDIDERYDEIGIKLNKQFKRIDEMDRIDIPSSLDAWCNSVDAETLPETKAIATNGKINLF